MQLYFGDVSLCYTYSLEAYGYDLRPEYSDCIEEDVFLVLIGFCVVRICRIECLSLNNRTKASSDKALSVIE